jgi:hypothetical protein
MSKLRKTLIVIWAVAMVASLYGWLRYSGVIATRTQPTPREVKVHVISMDELLEMYRNMNGVRVKAPPFWQEPETIRIEKMVEAGKAEWERDAEARRGH